MFIVSILSNLILQMSVFNWTLASMHMIVLFAHTSHSAFKGLKQFEGVNTKWSFFM